MNSMHDAMTQALEAEPLPFPRHQHRGGPTARGHKPQSEKRSDALWWTAFALGTFLIMGLCHKLSKRSDG